MRLQLLGPVELWSDAGTRIALGGPKQRALLALLALGSGEFVAESAVVACLWPDDPPASAARTVQSHVSRLRRALADAGVPADTLALLSHGRNYALRAAPGVIDVADVEDLANKARAAVSGGDSMGAAFMFGEAVRKWNGVPLQGIGDTEWVVVERRRLHELRQLLVEERVDADLACGRHADVLAELEELCRTNPMRERVWRQRMTALARSQRQADAVAAFDELCRYLAEELGIDPAPPTVELAKSIEAGRPLGAERRAAPMDTPTPPPRRHVPSGVTAAQHHRFVGRAPELARLEDAWRRAVTGNAQAVLVSGEPGIGKTALAARLADDVVAAGGTVLFGRCDEISVVAFQPWVEALTEYVEHATPAELTAALGGRAADLALLVPAVGRVLPNAVGRQTERTVAGQERYRIFEAVGALVGAACGSARTAVVLDDLQWADDSTLQLLRHVLRRRMRSPLLVVATYRDTDRHRLAAVHAALDDLAIESRTTRIRLAGLSRAEVAEILGAGGTEVRDAGYDRLAGTLWRDTIGNPLFVHETLRHLQDTGAVEHMADGRWHARRRIDDVSVPESVSDVIQQRLARLSPAADDALRVGCLAHEVRLDVVAHVTGVAEEQVLGALEQATAAGIVQESGMWSRWTFTHVLVRQSVYESLGATRRAVLHRRVGEALEELDGTDDGPHLGELAHHFLRAAGEGGKALEYARRAGDYALSVSAYDEAARHYGAAIEAATTIGARPDDVVDLLLAQADAEGRAGDTRRARATLERAAMLVAGTGGEAVARVATAYAAAGVRVVWADNGHTDARTVALLEDALRDLPEGDSPWRARTMAALGQALQWSPEALRRRQALTADAVAMARRLGDASLTGFALSMRTLAIWGPSASVEMTANAVEIVDIATSVGDRRLETFGRAVLAYQLVEENRIGEAAPAVARLQELSETLRDPLGLQVAMGLEAGLALAEGRFADAERLINETFQRGQDARDPAAFGMTVIGAGVLRILQGRAVEMVSGHP